MKAQRMTLVRMLALALSLYMQVSCQKDEIKAVVNPGNPSTLTATTTVLALQSSDAAKDAITFSWLSVDYGYPAAVTYTLEIDKKGNAFKAPVAIANGSTLKKTFSVADFNTLLINLGITPGSSGQIEARVKSDVSPSLPSIVSTAVSLTGTPYSVAIVYPALYVPGSYQGWAPDKAPRIVSVKSDKTYEGYVYFPDASTEFKLTDAPNWNAVIYGNKTGTNGALASPGDNLLVTGAGYYLLNADLTAGKWAATKTTWAVIGSATPQGWDGDTPLTYDATTGNWSATMNLVKGDIKFRANGAWDINYGDTRADGLLDLNGDNIAVVTDGNYVITLNLNTAGSYTYSIKK